MEGRLGPYKGKDFGSSLGPVFVTPDELDGRRSGNGYDLLMTSAVNGREYGHEYGHDHWSSAYWSFEEIISYASWNSVVEPGALIGSGTCQGGCILELSIRHSQEQYPWLTAGDEVTLSIEMMVRSSLRSPPRRAAPGPAASPRLPAEARLSVQPATGVPGQDTSRSTPSPTGTPNSDRRAW